MKKLNCILLIDDNPADNRFHQILIEEMNITKNIKIVESGFEALKFLKDKTQLLPDLIFLDINMPKMNGWEFLEEYKKLEQVIRDNIILVILTVSTNPDDINRAPEIDEINNFEFKPLTKRVLGDILKRYFNIIATN